MSMNTEQVLTIIRQPHTSEKTTRLADKHKQFTFKVLPDANKYQVKEAVETLFQVKVKSVTIVNVKGKVKRFKNQPGRRSDWKKAYVTLQDNYDIDFTVAE